MKNELCPYCGKKPRYTHYINAISGGHVVQCDNFSGCTVRPRCAAETESEAWARWNKRYVCPDKNGEPVYAGNEVNMEEFDSPVCRCKVSFTTKRGVLFECLERDECWNWGDVGEIELIKEPDNGE